MVLSSALGSGQPPASTLSDPSLLGPLCKKLGPPFPSEVSCFFVRDTRTKISSRVNGQNLVLKKWRARDSLPCSNFHVAFVPLAQLEVPGSPPAS